MAALSCACGKLLSCAVKLSYVSKQVVSVGCIEITYRSSLWRKNFHATPQIEASVRKGPRKKRDRLTVLKALASTVESVPNRPNYKFFDDLVLGPRISFKQQECLLSRESGEKAAEYVLEKFPHLFPLRNAEPPWPRENSLVDVDDSLENMRLLMRSGENISKVVELYTIICSKGDVSLDVHNEMLDFACFYAIPGDIMGETGVELDDNDTATESKWGENMLAEKLFADLKDKRDPRTYEVFILGLLKHGEIFKAFKTYVELKNKNISGSLYMYNTLLLHACEIANTKEKTWDLTQDIVGDMQKNNIKPNALTFNSIMAVAAEGRDRELCQQLLREMKMLDIAPSLGCYYHILYADRMERDDKHIVLQNMGVLHAIIKNLKYEMVDYVPKHPSDLLFLNTAMGITRFRSHFFGSQTARELLWIVIDNNLEHLLGRRKGIFFGNYICAIASLATDVDSLFKEYRSLVPKFFTPRDWVIKTLLEVMSNNKDPKHLPDLYNDMVSLRVPFKEESAWLVFSAMEENIPKERAGEYLFVVRDAEKWMNVFNINKTVATLSVAIKVLCLNGKYDEVKEKLEECNNLQIVPTADAMYAILELTINDGNIRDALMTLKTMAGYKMELTGTIEEIISSNDFLCDESEKIKSWFDIS